MHPAGAACQLCWPKPLLALQLPVNAAPTQVPRASSSPACIANLQEQPPVGVAAMSGGQARCGGGSSNAIGRWSGRPPSIGKEQCVYMSHCTMVMTTRPHVQAHNISTLRRTMATTTRPRVQVHKIYTLRCTTAMMTRPCAQAHTIFNITLHDGNNNEASCASA
jgi:hypothetical protein